MSFGDTGSLKHVLVGLHIAWISNFWKNFRWYQFFHIWLKWNECIRNLNVCYYHVMALVSWMAFSRQVNKAYGKGQGLPRCLTKNLQEGVYQKSAMRVLTGWDRQTGLFLWPRLLTREVMKPVKLKSVDQGTCTWTLHEEWGKWLQNKQMQPLACGPIQKIAY